MQVNPTLEQLTQEIIGNIFKLLRVVFTLASSHELI
jgi:hypothetical protein